MSDRVIVCGYCGSMDTIDGLSVCEQCVEEDMAWSEREVMPDYRDPFGRGLHHPDCCCNVCYYGEDAARWMFHPSEY